MGGFRGSSTSGSAAERYLYLQRLLDQGDIAQEREARESQRYAEEARVGRRGEAERRALSAVAAATGTNPKNLTDVLSVYPELDKYVGGIEKSLQPPPSRPGGLFGMLAPSAAPSASNTPEGAVQELKRYIQEATPGARARMMETGKAITTGMPESVRGPYLSGLQVSPQIKLPTPQDVQSVADAQRAATAADVEARTGADHVLMAHSQALVAQAAAEDIPKARALREAQTNAANAETELRQAELRHQKVLSGAVAAVPGSPEALQIESARQELENRKTTYRTERLRLSLAERAEANTVAFNKAAEIYTKTGDANAFRAAMIKTSPEMAVHVITMDTQRLARLMPMQDKVDKDFAMLAAPKVGTIAKGDEFMSTSIANSVNTGRIGIAQDMAAFGPEPSVRWVGVGHVKGRWGNTLVGGEVPGIPLHYAQSFQHGNLGPETWLGPGGDTNFAYWVKMTLAHVAGNKDEFLSQLSTLPMPGIPPDDAERLRRQALATFGAAFSEQTGGATSITPQPAPQIRPAPLGTTGPAPGEAMPLPTGEPGLSLPKIIRKMERPRPPGLESPYEGR